MTELFTKLALNAMLRKQFRIDVLSKFCWFLIFNFELKKKQNFFRKYNTI